MGWLSVLILTVAIGTAGADSTGSPLQPLADTAVGSRQVRLESQAAATARFGELTEPMGIDRAVE